MAQEEEKQPEQVEIRFGMIIENDFGGRTSQHVIIRLGENDWFVTSEILEIQGKKALAIPGTADISDITRITGEVWTKDQILEAYENYFCDCGGPPEGGVELIEKYSLAPPRILTK